MKSDNVINYRMMCHGPVITVICSYLLEQGPNSNDSFKKGGCIILYFSAQLSHYVQQSQGLSQIPLTGSRAIFCRFQHFASVELNLYKMQLSVLLVSPTSLLTQQQMSHMWRRKLVIDAAHLNRTSCTYEILQNSSISRPMLNSRGCTAKIYRWD